MTAGQKVTDAELREEIRRVLDGHQINALVRELQGKVSAVEAGPAWVEIGAAGAPAFGAGWANKDATRATAAYAVSVDGWVQLKGVVTNALGAAPGGVVFSLPFDPLPAREDWWLCSDGSATTGVRVEVLANGDVNVPGAVGAGTDVSLAAIRFRTA